MFGNEIPQLRDQVSVIADRRRRLTRRDRSGEQTESRTHDPIIHIPAAR
jgi:hypothetical protein